MPARFRTARKTLRRVREPHQPPPLFARLRHAAKLRPGIARSVPRRSSRLSMVRNSNECLLFLRAQSKFYGRERHVDANTSLKRLARQALERSFEKEFWA